MKAQTFVLLSVVAAVVLLAFSARAADRRSFSMSLSTILKGLGTQEIATREVDGLTVTYPADEADVIELLIPAITDYWAMRRESAKAEADAIIELLSDADIRANYREHLPRWLGLESLDEKEFDDSYDTAMKDIADYAQRWQQWSGDLSSLRIWNNATGEAFKEGERTVFPEISYEATSKEGKMNFTIRSAYDNQNMGLDLIRLPKCDDGTTVPIIPFRLDIPLFYAPGTPAEVLATGTRQLMEKFHEGIRGLMPKLVSTAQQGLTESLLQAAIKAHYFTPTAAATPEGAMLIRGLARYYLFAQMKSAGKITDDNAAGMLPRFIYFDFPDSDAAQAELLRDLESLDPFSGELREGIGDPDPLFVVGSRLVMGTLLKLAQNDHDNGRPIFQKLRRMDLIPAGGFDSVDAFTKALEAAYPSRVQKEFLAARTELLTSIKIKMAGSGSEVEPAPQPVGEEPPLPDREKQVFDGLTITHPPALREAIAKLGPELAAARKQARMRIEERINKVATTPTVPIADDTLEIIRTNGIDATRESADFYSSQAATFSNARPALVKMIFEWNAIQVWFKDDLRTLLKEGRQIPGFSYDPATDLVGFLFESTQKVSAPEEAVARESARALPIVLKDRSITDLKDVVDQVAMIRSTDKGVLPLLESADTASPALLGLRENTAGDEGLLTPDQGLFVSIHELVEADLLRHVIASLDRRWFCEGVANLLAIRACDHQLGATESNAGFKTFESLYDHNTLSKRAPDVDLLNWPASGDESDALKNDSELTQAHYYFATRVLLESTKGHGDDFLKTWIAKIRDTPWNRTNAATIIAAYDELTGGSLREVIERTVSVQLKSPGGSPRAK
ncbi:MAG: hypothetical protein ABI680_05885 [Chthoniobacteraceae bacterium]